MSQAHPGPAAPGFLRFTFSGWKAFIVPLVAAAVALRAVHANAVLVFALAAAALVPAAVLIGQATEELAAHVGATAGGMLNATLGNVTELIFGIVALAAGQTEVVKASITGSIIGNLLLVFGLAAFLGGIGRKRLHFSQLSSNSNLSMLFLAVVALVMPALFQFSVLGSLEATGRRIERLSLWTSCVLLACYVGSLVFVFVTHRNLFRAGTKRQPVIGKGTVGAALCVATVLAAIATDVLVSQIAATTHSLGWTDLFVGIVIVATVGNATEHSTAVVMARRNEMDLALNVAVGSSTQIALFVAPALVVISQFLPDRMSLVFHPLEIAAIILSVGAVALVCLDGETHWFEGLQLLGVYVVLVVFFYFVPTSFR